MTITSTPSEISYAGDGVSTVFPIPFVFDTSADLKIVSTDSDGNPVVLSSGFSIAGGAGATGTCTLTSALASGYTLTIIDNPAQTQEADYVDNDAFPAETHERALDRGVRISKRIYQLLSKSLRVADGDPSAGTGVVLGSVQARKGKYLFFNAITGAIEYAASIIGTTLSQSIIAQLLNPQTTEEALNGVTPVNNVYEARNVRRYGEPNIGDGITNASTAFAACAQAYPYTAKYVPEGRYILTSFGSLEGWYGPGELIINGQRIYIPLEREQTNPLVRLGEQLSRIRGNFQNVTVVGDSIADYYYVTAEHKHWFSMLRDGINFLQNNGDFDLTTNFDDPYIKTYTLGGGTSFGTTGPLGRSLILAVGGYIEFTGAFDNIDCFFDRAVGAGSLAFSYNGGAAYKTVSCAGATQLDYHTTQVAGFVATSATSGTHRITCTGAPVTVTGLCRLLRVYGAVSLQTRFARIARAGYSTTQFANSTILLSVKALGCSSEPVTNTTKQSLFLVALGTNNMYNITNQTTVTAFLVDLLKIFAMLSEAGSIIYLAPAKPGRATLTGSDYESYMAAAKIACDAFNVPFVPLNAFPYNNAGLTTDNLHPDDSGNTQYLEVIAEAICQLQIPGPAQIAQTRDLGNYLHAVNPGGTASINYGLSQGAYFNGTNYIATKATATGYLANGNEHKVYHDSGLTIGSSFTPTLVYTINSSKQVTFEQNTQTKGTLFVGPSKTINLLTVPATYANDAAAAAGGVAVGDFYRNGSILMIRVV